MEFKIKPTESYDENFWIYNYPVQLWRDEETKEVSYVIYKPRKENCWNSSNDNESIPKEELNDFIDNSIAKFKKAIDLFEKFKRKEIDNVYYFDSDNENKQINQ